MGGRPVRLMGWVAAGVLALAAPQAFARSLLDIKQSGALKICVAGSSMALYQANGEAFARHLGVRPEVHVLISFDEQFQNRLGVTLRDQAYVPRVFEEGICDLLPNDLQIVPWRTSKMLIVPYYRVRNVVVTRLELLPQLRGTPDLAGRSAAVLRGTNYDDWLQRANRGALSGNPVRVAHMTTIEAARSVAEGKADFTVAGTEGALRWVREQPDKLAIAFPTEESLNVGWAVSPGETTLARELERFFAASKRVDSELDRNWRRYYGASLMEYQLFEASFTRGGIDLESILRWAVPSGAAALLLLAAMLFWNRRLKREVGVRLAAEDALLRAHSELDAIFESASSAIALVRDLRILRCNRRLEEMFGYGPGEVLGQAAQKFFGLSDEENESTVQRVREQLVRGETYRREKQLARKDGSLFWCRYSGHAFDPTDLSRGTVWILEDVAEEHAAADALREAKSIAEEATRAKSMFLASMSHEIRTPMNGVLGMLQLLAFSPLNAEQKATLEGAEASARSLLRIIDDLLDFSKIEAGRLEIRPEPASIAAVVESVRLVYSGVASAKDLSLSAWTDPALSPALSVDALRLRQILNNFVSNAIKFTQKGGVEIRADLAGRDAGRETVRFSVTDTGIGVSAEAQARLFQPYVQAAVDTARQYGGTGLGLTICRRLADMMEGLIEMRSEPGRGTTMTFTVPMPVADVRDLPKADPSAAAAARIAGRRKAPAIEAAQADGTLVLIAEDHPTNRTLLTRLLGLLGYASVAAEDGREALEQWKSGRFGIVITDCNMPVMDGYELARAIRAEEASSGRRRVPIVACTANALGGDAQRCMDAGMDDFVAKPVEMQALASVLERRLPLPGGQGALAAVRATPAAGAEDAPLDRSSLAAISGGDATAERDILADFKAVNETDAQALRGALGERDLPKVTHAAHRVKGACRTVGAAALAAVCERMEKAARQNSWAAVEAEQAAFEREFDRLDTWLAKHG